MKQPEVKAFTEEKSEKDLRTLNVEEVHPIIVHSAE
jgi:hypothetical protein